MYIINWRVNHVQTKTCGALGTQLHDGNLVVAASCIASCTSFETWKSTAVRISAWEEIRCPKGLPEGEIPPRKSRSPGSARKSSDSRTSRKRKKVVGL